MDFEFYTAEKNPTLSAKLVGNGRGAGSSITIQTVSLSDLNSGTKVGWSADITIGGVMAGLGSKLIESTSSKRVNQVMRTLRVS